MKRKIIETKKVIRTNEYKIIKIHPSVYYPNEIYRDDCLMIFAKCKHSGKARIFRLIGRREINDKVTFIDSRESTIVLETYKMITIKESLLGRKEKEGEEITEIKVVYIRENDI